MPYSYVTYSGNGSQTQFNIPFGYLQAADVTGVVNGVAAPGTASGTTFTFTTAPAAGSNNVKIQRVTGKASRPINFADASTVTALNLNSDALRAFYIDQELSDIVQAPGVPTGILAESYGGTGTTSVSQALVTSTGGTAARPLDDIAARVLSVSDFAGADPTGASENTSVVQAAITAAAGATLIIDGDYRCDGTLTVSSRCTIFGPGRLILNQAGGNSLLLTGSDITLMRVRFGGTSPGGVSPRSGATRIRIDNCHFEGLGQCVWLWACSNVSVTGCTFKDIGNYGIVQQLGYSSSYGRVSGCTFTNCGSDAIELNCASVQSYGWVITDNRYVNASGYPTPGTEKRFCGITNVLFVTVANNFVTGAAGDSAIHLEDVGGEIIVSGNTLVNCIASAGAGIIYILSSSQNFVVGSNVIIQTDPAIGSTYWAISLVSGSYTCAGVITGNRIAARNGAGFYGIDLSNHSGGVSVTGNHLSSLQWGIAVTGTSGATINANVFKSCVKGIQDSPSVSSGSLTDSVISNNVFSGSTGDNVNLNKNTSGTNGPKRLVISGNKFDRHCKINDAEDCLLLGNQVAAGYVVQCPVVYGGGARSGVNYTRVIGTGITP